MNYRREILDNLRDGLRSHRERYLISERKITKLKAKPRQAFASGIRSLFGLIDVDRMTEKLLVTIEASTAE